MNLYRSIIIASIIVLFTAPGCGDDELRKKGPQSDSNTSNNVSENNSDVMGSLNNANNTPSSRNHANNTTIVENNAIDPADDFGPIHVQLTWDTDDTDLDLHFAHPLAALDTDQPDIDGDQERDPWLHPTYDCSPGNNTPVWGPDGTNNPVHDVDAWDGFGPENTNLDEPESVSYRIGVRYNGASIPGDPSLKPPTMATVKVFIGSDLKYEVSQTLSHFDMWEVAATNTSKLAGWRGSSLAPSCSTGSHPTSECSTSMRRPCSATSGSTPDVESDWV